MPAIIDGSTGVVVLRPSEATFKEYLKRKQNYEYLERELESYRELPSITTDGVHVSLRGNLELSSEFGLAHKHATQGVGLYRTEFLYLGRQDPPTEQEQVDTYRTVLQEMGEQPVTIRTLDIGGDKFVPELNLEDEANPAMGLRAIRFFPARRAVVSYPVKGDPQGFGLRDCPVDVPDDQRGGRNPCLQEDSRGNLRGTGS